MGISLGTIAKVASVASTIGSHVDLSDVTSGFNLSGVTDIGSISSMSDSVVSKLQGKANGIVSELTGLNLDSLNADSISSNLDIDSKVEQMVSDMEKQAMSSMSSNPADYEAMLNSMDIDGQMNQIMNESLSGMGLDSISYM